MLFRLLLVRLMPLLILKLCRERKMVKLVSSVVLLIHLLFFFIATGEIMSRKGFLGLLYLPAAMFPHGALYLFALWMLLRCIWQEWSQRVWRRIYALSIVCIVCGIFMEAYWNPLILQFFSKIFK